MQKQISMFFRKVGSSRIAGIAANIALVVVILTLAGCSGKLDTEDITLELTSGSTIVPGGSLGASFDVKTSTVLRCASMLENEQQLMVTTSKSKDMEARFLFFVEPVEAGNTPDNTLIAIVPITGKEYEYDMAQARYFNITSSSAATALKNYGITYTDWQAGAANSSEKFPCCE